MVHIGQVSVPASIKEMLSVVDDLETLLEIRKIFQKSFDTLFNKLCSPNSPSKNSIFKRDTLGTPKFNQLVSGTRNCVHIWTFLVQSTLSKCTLSKCTPSINAHLTLFPSSGNRDKCTPSINALHGFFHFPPITITIVSHPL